MIIQHMKHVSAKWTGVIFEVFYRAACQQNLSFLQISFLIFTEHGGWFEGKNPISLTANQCLSSLSVVTNIMYIALLHAVIPLPTSVQTGNQMTCWIHSYQTMPINVLK